MTKKWMRTTAQITTAAIPPMSIHVRFAVPSTGVSAVAISGITASTGRPSAPERNVAERTDWSLNSLSAADPTPDPIPSTSPISRMAGMFGDTGFSGSRAASISVKRSPIWSFSRPEAVFDSMYFFEISSYLACRLLRLASKSL